jgi:hypothetical protein
MTGGYRIRPEMAEMEACEHYDKRSSARLQILSYLVSMGKMLAL